MWRCPLLRIQLTEAQRVELEALRDRGQPAYLRERAAAILKVDAGHSATQVACSMLLRPGTPHLVRQWLRRYLAQGVAGLYQLPRNGAGRPPGAKDRVPRQQRPPARRQTPITSRRP